MFAVCNLQQFFRNTTKNVVNSPVCCGPISVLDTNTQFTHQIFLLMVIKVQTCTWEIILFVLVKFYVNLQPILYDYITITYLLYDYEGKHKQSINILLTLSLIRG